MKTSKSIQLIIGDIVRAMCEQPDAVNITTRDLPRTISLEIRPAACDVSKIIGKAGKNIKAIQLISEAMGDTLQRRIFVSVLTNGNENGFKKFSLNPSYYAKNEAALLGDLLGMVFHDGVSVALKPLDNRSSVLLVEGIDHLEKSLEDAIVCIFTAIGKNKGHELFVEFA